MESLAKSVFSSRNLTTEAICHGRAFEDTAVAKFHELYGHTVKKAGLFIDPDLPFLAASPDGIIEQGQNKNDSVLA